MSHYFVLKMSWYLRKICEFVSTSVLFHLLPFLLPENCCCLFPFACLVTSGCSGISSIFSWSLSVSVSFCLAVAVVVFLAVAAPSSTPSSCSWRRRSGRLSFFLSSLSSLSLCFPSKLTPLYSSGRRKKERKKGLLALLASFFLFS